MGKNEEKKSFLPEILKNSGQKLPKVLIFARINIITIRKAYFIDKFGHEIDVLRFFAQMEGMNGRCGAVGKR